MSKRAKHAPSAQRTSVQYYTAAKQKHKRRKKSLKYKSFQPWKRRNLTPCNAESGLWRHRYTHKKYGHDATATERRVLLRHISGRLLPRSCGLEDPRQLGWRYSRYRGRNQKVSRLCGIKSVGVVRVVKRSAPSFDVSINARVSR